MNKELLQVEDERIQLMMDSFAKDYDLSSMNYNDRLALRVLCGLYLQIQDNTEKLEDIKAQENWKQIPDIVDINKKLIDNIETLEKQLGISRKARGKDKETSVLDYIQSLLEKAKKFIDKKLIYIYCPDCQMLLANVWFLYPQENNELNLTCGRCKKSFMVFSEDFDKEKTEVIQKRDEE